MATVRGLRLRMRRRDVENERMSEQGQSPEPGAQPRAEGEPGPRRGGHREGETGHELLKLVDEVAGGRAAVIPAWRQRSMAESRWPVTLTVVAALVLQGLLPQRLAPHPVVLLPALEIALFIGLLIANPVRFERRSAVVRAASIVLVFPVTLHNTWG